MFDGSAVVAAVKTAVVQAYCAWKTAQDGQLVRYRVITEAEHQLIRNRRDRMDAYLLTANSTAGAAPAAAGAVSGAAVNGVPAGKGAAAVASKGANKAVNISVTVGGAAAAAVRAENVDMAMVVSGQDAVKVSRGRDGSC